MVMLEGRIGIDASNRLVRPDERIGIDARNGLVENRDRCKK